jgi:predicted dehydrogenase
MLRLRIAEPELVIPVSSEENFIFVRNKSDNPNIQLMNKKLIQVITCAVALSACSGGGQKTAEKATPRFTGAKGEVKLMTLDPGHFHAALIQKSMYEQIDPQVYVYAPEGDDVTQHLARIEAFNKRAESPTAWVEKVYTGTDYLEKMLTERPGNVMMVAGNNAKKTEYIQKAVEVGLNVFADKPMVITPEAFPVLEQAFKTAEEKGVLLYDIMTERHEITSIIQRDLANTPEIFGSLTDGTPEQPAVTKESVHHFSKMVAGSALKRPAWFFDTDQQGEGIVDVTTHLVDLIQWGCFPEVILNKSDVQMISAKHWTTGISPEEFKKVTGLKEFPEYLKKDVADGNLNVYSNGEMVYKLKGKVCKVSVIWNFEAPEGTGDTHYSIMRGTRSNVMIKQGKEENYKPTVYIEANGPVDLNAFEASLKSTVEQKLASKYVGLKLNKLSDKLWTVEIPEQYKVGHEAHFSQVTQQYLQYLKDGKLPEWEVPNMITKYYTTTEALKLARQ